MKWIRPFLFGVILTALLQIPVYYHFREIRIQEARQTATGRQAAEWDVPQDAAPPPRRSGRMNARRALVHPVTNHQPVAESPNGSAAAKDSLPGDDPSAVEIQPVVDQFPNRSQAAVPVLRQAQPPPPSFISQTANSMLTVVDGVLVPVPSEIFALMDQLGTNHWASTQRPFKGVIKPFGLPRQQALFLGTLAAEGFLAIELRDLAQVQHIGRSLVGFGEALGVRSAIVSRVSAIIQAARAGDWATARMEMDGTLTNVKAALVALRSPELATLISLGGWARGAEAFSLGLKGNDAARWVKLLNQPTMVKYFASSFANFAPAVQRDPLVAKAIASLNDVNALLAREAKESHPEKMAQEFGRIAKNLVDAIQTQPK